MTWRNTRKRSLHANLERAIAEAALKDAANLPTRSPEECLSNDKLLADASEQANSITRDRETGTLCLTIDYWDDLPPKSVQVIL
jgi:hypothetical protein